MVISATEKAAMNSNIGCRSSRVKKIGKKAEEAAAQQRLEEEMTKAEAELKKEAKRRKWRARLPRSVWKGKWQRQKLIA